MNSWLQFVFWGASWSTIQWVLSTCAQADNKALGHPQAYLTRVRISIQATKLQESVGGAAMPTTAQWNGSPTGTLEDTDRLSSSVAGH